MAIETVDSYRALCDDKDCGWKSNVSLTSEDAQASLDNHNQEHEIAARAESGDS